MPNSPMHAYGHREGGSVYLIDPPVGATVPVTEDSPGVTQYFPLVPNVSPCTVAPNQLRDLSVGGIYKVEVGERGRGL